VLYPTRGWSAHDLPDLSGRHVIVTGATSGIGLETAVALAGAGASVMVTARDPARGNAARTRVRRAAPRAEVEVGALDLADLSSVRSFAAEHRDRPLDLLINNAGVMAVPPRRTADGFELQMGTNHLGHFALTGLLLPALLRAKAPRVVTVSSVMHWWGSLNFADLMTERRYDPWVAYARSKLANLLFARELGRRAAAAATNLASVAAHPGVSRTNLFQVGPQMAGRRATGVVMRVGTALLAQSARAGALPLLRAAVDPELSSGDYLGPRGPGEWRGRPAAARRSANSRDDTAARLLWDASEQLTGVEYRFACR